MIFSKEHSSLSSKKTRRLTLGEKSISYVERADIELLLEPDPPFWTKTSWLQLGYGIWVNLTLMNIGLCIEFSAVAIPQLKEENTITMTKNEEASIASILTLSSPIGCVIAGILLDKFGRKSGLIWCQVPIAVGWFYTAFATYAKDIILGRVITGVGLGMAMAAPRAYSAEITLPNMRGVIGALPNLAISFGLTIQAVLGALVGWRGLCILCGGYAILLCIANKFLPDTPYYILLHSSASAARTTLRRFRSSKFNVDAELQTLEEFKTANNIRRLTLCETKKALTKSSACKPFGIILFYIALSHFAGVNVITTWAVEMLQIARSSIDAHLGNIILTLTRIVLGFATSLLLFRVGRRPLALISALGIGGIGIIFGSYLHSAEGGRSPLILMIAFVAFAVPGYHTLPTLMMFELFPLQLRGILSGIVLSCSNLLMFGAVHTFPTLRDGMGLANTFITYGVISLIGAIALYFILPETRHLTLQEIEEYFNHRRLTLVSSRVMVSAQQRSQMLSLSVTSTKDKAKKNKRLRVVSSDDEEEAIRKKESSNSKDLEKRAGDLSFDDIVIVYDEDAIENVERDEKYKVDHDKKDKVKQSEKENVNSEEKDRKDTLEKVKTEKANVDGEKKDKEDETKKNKKEQDKTDKPSTSRS